MKRKMRKRILIGLAVITTLAIGLYFAYAAITNWPFTLSSNYTVSDSNKIEVAGGAAKLKAQASSQDTQAELEGTSPNVASGVGYGASSDGAVRPTSEISSSETGLVGLWHMNNDWIDSSGNLNHGTPSGATFVIPGKLGSHAGKFDGVDDYV
ncbi:MAG: hypothetical protein KKG50_08775, partial [Candidatus Omnitrophica bacterium]|nr:hypothetical protein [Candidatus Omnitrophota bacterium]